MRNKFVLLLFLYLALLMAAQAQITITLTANLASPQPVGTVVTWTATATGSTKVSFQFRTVAGTTVNVVRDYSALNTLSWTTLQEGSYSIWLKVIDLNTNTVYQKQAPFTFTSRVAAGAPVVSATAHPLVALYSAPPCGTGQIRVQFQPAGATTWQTTPPQNCTSNQSANFYVAGMLPNTTYLLQHVLTANVVHNSGSALTFRTGSPPFSLPGFAVLSAPDTNTSSENILLTSFFNIGSPVTQQLGFVATDLSGNILWYYPGLVGAQNGSYLTRPVNGGTFLMLVGQKYAGQIIREVDLAGNTVRETNVQRINSLLTAQGKGVVNWLSHECLRLPNGHTLVLGAVERLLTNIQGPGTVDVLGDMVIDLDQNFQVTWSWNAFDFLDQARKAVLGETCSGGAACPPLFLAPDANDWTHTNAIHYLPDGNLLLSMRNQDWVVKIQYQDGTGPGTVLWRLGPSGDFTLTNGTGPFPWFSHQHSIYFDGTNYGLFDNGNTRVVQMGGTSRGQVYSLNEAARTATQVLNVNLGVYSYHWGSSQTLANGNYYFMAGDLGVPLPTGEPMEFLPGGAGNYNAKVQPYAYRSFRLSDLYTYHP